MDNTLLQFWFYYKKEKDKSIFTLFLKKEKKYQLDSKTKISDSDSVFVVQASNRRCTVLIRVFSDYLFPLP